MKDDLKRLISRLLSVRRTVEKTNEIWFCFAGEFGYEIVSWMPYLLFLKEKTGIKLNTISRPGSKVLYYFSDNHLEAGSQDLTAAWGDRKSYQNIKKTLKIGAMVHPLNRYNEGRAVVINGFEWKNKDIHAPIDRTCYIRPDFSKISSPLPFAFEKYAVINNKLAKEWLGKPVNYFNRDDLISLRDMLRDRGYSVVYNRFFEKTAFDEDYELDDEDIFIGDGNYDMRNYYAAEKDADKRNAVQISMFNRSAFVIGVQGGNIYLPAACSKRIFMLMRKGKYIDYQELARIFGTQIDVFYEPDHLRSRLERYLSQDSA